MHKVQGLSLDAAVMDLGKDVFESAMAYVALSRVCTLNGVALLKFELKKMTVNKRVHKEMARLRQQFTCGSISQSDGQTSGQSVQNCKRPDESNGVNRISPLVESKSAVLHSEKQTFSTKKRNDELHCNQKPSVVYMEDSQSVHLNPIVNVDAQLVSSRKTAQEVIVIEIVQLFSQ